MICSNFDFTIFSLILFPYFPKVFTSILKVDEILKIYHKVPYCQLLVLATISYHANSDFIWLLNYTPINFVEPMP